MYTTIVKIPVNNFFLEGDLTLPVKAKSIIIFSHGSGSSRYSPRNKMVARELHAAGFGTLLFDLMNEQEQDNYTKRFDFEMLTRRLVSITLWIYNHAEYENFDFGYFGSGTGAAAALNASITLHDIIKAVVIRGGRTDLIEPDDIEKIKSPTLLIAGELDFHTLKLNRKLLKKLKCQAQLMVVPGATHLLEEPGKLKQAAKASITWFGKFLRKGEMDPSLEYELPDERYD